MKDTGGELLTKRAMSPQAISGSSAVNGVAIDRKGFESGVFTIASGAAGGTPTSFSMAIKVQHADASNFATPVDVTTAQNNDGAVTATITAIDSEAEVNVDFRKLKRYVRVVVTPTFVGGSSPDLLVASSVALGECYINPAA